MEPHEIVQVLIESDEPLNIEALIDEASVHLPRRGSLWVASFRDGTGRQLWRATGSRSRKEALALAKQWEEEARRRRARQGVLPPRPVIRVRPGSGEREVGLLTQREVATIMEISERAVRGIERRAFDKLRRHPALRDFWREYQTGEIREAAVPIPSAWTLSRAEVAAVYALARTPDERRALGKLMTLVAR